MMCELDAEFIPLSKRVRPNIEAAPWVIDAIISLEQKLQHMKEELEINKATRNIGEKRGLD